jgi:spore maturation protein SpmA
LLNWIWLGLVLSSVVFAAFTGRMEAVSQTSLETAKRAIELVIGLTGAMVFFLGLVRVASDGGLLRVIIRGLRPLLRRLFPGVPADHPAMTAIVMNFASNMLGLGNAATPFGLKAMVELDKLNRHKGVATNAMALFLAINTSSITLLPTGVIALRAAAGSADPAGILPTTLFATLCSTVVAIVSCKLYQRYWPSAAEVTPAGEQTASSARVDAPEVTLPEAPESGYPGWVSGLALLALVALIPVAVLLGASLGPWIVPGLAVLLLGFGVARRVRVYECFVDGARDGFEVAVRIIPYLVAILVAVGMFRASGAMDIVIGAIGGFTAALGMPAEALPMALLRPLSGSGAYGVLAATIAEPATGPDTYVGYLVSTLQGSTETTFYVLAVYFGAVQVRRVRHALAAGLTADLAGIVGAVVACLYLFG